MSIENILLLIGAIATTIFVWGPPLGAVLGLSRFGCSVYGTPGDVLPSGSDAEYERLFNKLQELGYRPIGLKKETVTFFGMHWLYKSISYAFAADDQRSFALIYQFSLGSPWIVGLHSSFESGQIVYSSNAGLEVKPLEKYDHAHTHNKDLEYLVRFHEERLEKYIKEGDRVVISNQGDVLAKGSQYGLEISSKNGLAASLVPAALMFRLTGYGIVAGAIFQTHLLAPPVPLSIWLGFLIAANVGAVIAQSVFIAISTRS